VFSYQEASRLIRLSDSNINIEDVTRLVLEEWNVGSDASLEERSEELISMLKSHGVNKLSIYETNLALWAKLYRNTVLRDANSLDSNFIHIIQEKVDVLISAIEAESFRSITDPTSLEKSFLNIAGFIGLLRTFIDNGTESFSEMSRYEIGILGNTAIRSLPFEQRLWAYSCLDPNALEMQIEGKNLSYERALVLLDKFKRMYPPGENLILSDEIEWLKIDKLVPTQVTVNRAIYELRIEEIGKGVNIPLIVLINPGATPQDEPRMYVCDGHHRYKVTAENFDIDKIGAFVIRFKEHRPNLEMEKYVQNYHLFGPEDIRVVDSLTQERESQEIDFEELLANLGDIELPDDISVDKFTSPAARDAIDGFPIVARLEWGENEDIYVVAKPEGRNIRLFYVLPNFHNRLEKTYLGDGYNEILKGEGLAGNSSCGVIKVIDASVSIGIQLQAVGSSSDQILVAKEPHWKLAEFIREDRYPSGVIIESSDTSHRDYEELVQVAQSRGIPLIVGVKNARSLLRDGMFVEMNVSNGSIGFTNYQYRDGDVAFSPEIFTLEGLQRVEMDDLFEGEAVLAKIQGIWESNSSEGMPSLIAISGWPGLGKTVLNNRFIRLIEENDSITASAKQLYIQNYLYPADRRPTETTTDPLLVNNTVQIPNSSIFIYRLSETKIRINYAALDEAEVNINSKYEEVQVPGHNIFITLIDNDKFIVRMPEFLAKYDLGRFYKDVERLKRGDTIYSPKFNSRLRIIEIIPPEEIEMLRNADAEEIEDDGMLLVHHEKLSQEYQEDIWINTKTGDVLSRIVPGTDIILVRGVLTLYKPLINELYDWKIFVDTHEMFRREEFKQRHILEGWHEDLTLAQVEAKFNTWRQTQYTYQGPEKETYPDIVVSYNDPIEEENFIEAYGLTWQERIVKAMEVMQRESSVVDINPYEKLDYVRIVLSPMSVLYKTIELITTSKFSPETIRTYLDIDNNVPPFNGLGIEEEEILRDILEKLNLLLP